MPTDTAKTLDAVHKSYQDHGFAIVPEPVVEADLIARVRDDIPRIINGDYPTGRAPFQRHWNPGDDPNTFVKIDQVHGCSEAMMELVHHAEIGRYAAAATGADMVQMWASQMIIKPSTPGSISTALGWHQDDLYWQHSWDGELFTCWVAIADVAPNSGPVRYVAGSHRWPVAQEADFRDHDLVALRERLSLPDDAQWDDDHAAVLPAGGIAFHHKRTMHASDPNSSGSPRMGFILHLRTERATPRAGVSEMFGCDLDDDRSAPILFRR